MKNYLLTTTFLFIIFIVQPFSVNAEVAKWVQNGAPVSTYDNGYSYKFFPSVTGAGNDNAFIVWEDYRDPLAGDIYVQKVDVNGTSIFKNNSGITADRKATVDVSADKRFPNITKDGSGNAFVVWEDYRNGDNNIDIYVQKIDSNGIPLWGSDKLVCSATGKQRYPQIILSNTSPVEAIVVWEDYRNSTYSQIYAQKISSNGDPQWALNGIPIDLTTTNQRSPAIAPDGSTGAMIVWADWRSISTKGVDIYGQRIDSLGAGLWSSAKMAITDANEDQMFPAIAGDGLNYIVTWEDYRTGIFTSDIYAKGIDGSGSPLFVDQDICSAKDADNNAADQRYPRVAYSTADNGFIILWEDYRNDPANYIADVYAHKITYDGTIRWTTTNGVQVAKIDGSTQDAVSVTSLDTKGVIATWEDSRSNSVYDIYALPLPIPGSISINNGASNTVSSTVTLNLWASSFGVGSLEMRCSNDGSTWSTWETYSTTSSSCSLAGNQGTNTVYAQFRDSSTPDAQVSPAYSDDITLANVTINNGADYTTSESVTLSLAGSNCTMEFSNNNSTWSGYETCASSKAWTLSSGDGLKTVYVHFRDNTTLNVTNSSDTITLDKTAPIVNSTYPSNNDAGIELNPSVTITFSEAIESSTITSANIYLKQGVTLIDASLGYSTATFTATLTPNNKLSINTSYTVYIVGVKDIAGNTVSSSSFSFTTIADNTPPTGTIKINSDAVYANNLTVTLTIFSPDSDVSQMRFSADGSSWKEWKSYNTSASFNLPSGDGTKSVYVQFQDGVGNIPITYSNSDEILLDMTLPTGTITLNSGATYSNSASVTLTLLCSDTNGCSQMQFSNDNSTWSTAEGYAASKTWTLANNDGSKTVYVKFKDNAGNWSNASSATIILDITAPSGGTGVTPIISLGSVPVTAGQTYSYSKIVASWTSLSDPTAGLKEYMIAVGTTPGGTDILNWTPTAVPSYTTGDISSDNFGKTLYISIKAVDLLGNESSILISSSFVYTPGDINSKGGIGDGRVDGFDLGFLGIAYNPFGAIPTGFEAADINRDGVVNFDDLSILAVNFGKAKP